MPREKSSTSPFGRLTDLDPDRLMASGLGEPTPELDGLEIERMLGTGGMGTVYLGRQPGIDREVAIKVVSEALAQDPVFIERLEREARTLARLEHPNIVKVHDCLRLPEGGTAIIMEYVEGGDLRRKLSSGRLPVPEAMRIGREIALALAAAHRSGVVHRDLKPENILLDADGSVRVVDFGVAVPIDSRETRLTLTGTTVGTLDYMAPESFEHAEPDLRGDVYSLGSILYEMLTGKVPRGSFASPRKLRAEVPAKVSQAVMKALRPEPAERFADMAAFAKALAPPSPLKRRTFIAAAGAAGIVGLSALARRFGERRQPAVTRFTPRQLPAPDVHGWHWLEQSLIPEQDRISGGWTKDDEGLVSNDEVCVLAAWDELPLHHKLNARFTRLSGEQAVAVFFRHPRGMGTIELNPGGEPIGCIQSIDGRTRRDSQHFDFKIRNGRSHHLLIEIDVDKISIWIDGKSMTWLPIAEQSFSIPDDWDWDGTVPAISFAIGSYKSPTRFEQVGWLDKT